MIIGFLGKGGSGKSTLSSLYARYLASADCDVLAIDADHNMDFSYNLGLKDEMEQYVGQGLPELLGAINVNGDYREAFFLDQDPRFTFHPNDPFTAQFAIDLEPNLALMVTGPHTAAILFDQSCSHSLITPLKIYLPFLDLGPKQFAIVDEKAGVDGVGTGITTGFDVAVVVSEPTRHGVKAAQQIIKLLEFYSTPYLWVLNKVVNEDEIASAESVMGRKPNAIFGFERPDFSKVQSSQVPPLQELHTAVLAMKDSGPSRAERSKKKFQRNRSFSEDDQYQGI